MSARVNVLIPRDGSLVSTFKSNLPKTLPPLSVPVQIDSIALTLNGLVDGSTRPPS